MQRLYLNKKQERTRNKFLFKVRFKQIDKIINVLCVLCVFNFCVSRVSCNRPPKFILDGQTEIVLRLKEGIETPVDTLIYKLKGYDPDGDTLEFGVRQQLGSDILRVESISSNEADIYLNQELDREVCDEYALVLTLTDRRLGLGNFVTQSLLLLVEDVNDNVPIFKSHQSTVTIREDAKPDIITSLQATDADEGAYGQVVYHLQELDSQEKSLFSISTISGKGVIRLTGSLDYEKQTLHQLKVLAVDRAKQGRVNTGSITLLVKVEDVEDQPPEFFRIHPVVRIAEDVPVGTSVLQITAVDGDRGVNNPIAYSLTSNSISQEAELFTIEKTTGVVRTSGLLDRESNSAAYILQITATEIGGLVVPAPHAITEVTVILTDINDESPKFRSSHYECEVAENAPNNTPLLFLNNALPEVFDHDQGNNGTFQLHLLSATNMFEVSPSKIINEATFLIRVKNATLLDYEQLTIINFTLVAREIVTINPKENKVDVVVHIRDRNDNYPEFTKSVYEVTVPENCEVGTTIAWVQALDDDSENYGSRGVRYTNLAGSIASFLHLHPVSGIISVKTSGGPNWDRELISRHYLTVEARDDLGRGNRNSVQLIINLSDVNDNAPVFTQGFYESRLMENENDFEVPLKVEARDADLLGSNNSKIEYSLLGEWRNNFTIDFLTGVIKPKSPLDFEQVEGSLHEHVRTLSLTVRAKDKGSPSLFSDCSLIIYLHDVNDFAPVFEYTYYNKSISEMVSGGTPILQIRAYDLDGSAPNNQVIYRIQSGASDKFIIGAETGMISVAPGATLDPDLVHPKRTHYSLTIVALDGAPGETQRHAVVHTNITIMDVNNKPPVFIETGLIRVRENIPVGTVITKVVANDLDSSSALRFKFDPSVCEAKTEQGISLRNVDYGCSTIFNLGVVDGVLTIAKPLDREVAEIIHIGVIVEDIASETGVQTAKTSILMEIEDVNDNNPKFRKTYYRYAIAENSKNGAVIGSVIADDFDKNRTITYDLEGPQEVTRLVHLDSSTGDLIVANKIDHEIHTWLNLTVKATDSGVPPRSSRTELYVQILDENDNNPYFMPEPKILKIPENISVGQTVAILEAKDADSGEFGKITYLLDRLSSQGKFTLDSDTGVLKVTEALDREDKSSYLLIVEAWDNYQYGYNSGESRNAFKHINITIVDINDNPPKLLLPSSCISITEFHNPGQQITLVHATDADNPETGNGQIMLDISGGNDLNYFYLHQVDEWTGELQAAKSLTGNHGNITLIIRAQDLGSPSHTIEAPLHICITDFNDHAPIFISPPHNSTLRVPENTTVGSALVQIIATDEDVGSNGAVRYRLKSDPAGHWKTFNLQPVSGILELRLPLDRSVLKIYDIRIEAYDLGVPTPLSSDLDLTIYISNINDYQPQFMVDEVVLELTENTELEEESLKLPKTLDRDEFEYEGPLNPICYFIVGGNEQGFFKLNPIAHELSVSLALDREIQDTHLLLVKATDNCNTLPSNQSFFDSSDDTLLKVVVKVLDVNDNAPKFKRSIFTGGVSTATDFGTLFMNVQAEDKDEGINAELKYYLIGNIQMTLTEGLENLHRQPFLVEPDTGGIKLNFDPQQGMKGYFDFMVMVNDTGGLEDRARVFIYLLREDQRVRFVLRQHASELRNRIETFSEVLGNVTGAIVNVDEFRIHASHDGVIDKTKTDLYLHLVNQKDNSILEVDEVLRLVDQNTERLDNLFKEFNVLDTQPSEPFALQSAHTMISTFWLTTSFAFLFLLLLLCLTLCVKQRFSYQRKLKAATATAYVGGESEVDDRGLSALSGRVPNTNKHSVEGSNPMWMQAYENEWYKTSDEISCQGSDRDSLDENVLSENENNRANFEHQAHLINRAQNLYQTLPPLPIPNLKKLETTEL